MTGGSTSSSSARGSNATGPLQVDLKDLQKIQFTRTVVKLQGVCPLDEPTWFGYTGTNSDRRWVEPCAVRFTSNQSLYPYRWLQDTMMKAIWDKVRQILIAHNLTATMPSILFDFEPSGEQASLVDLVFPTPVAALHILTALPAINFSPGKGLEDCVFTSDMWTNTLKGDIFPIDCIRLPVDAANSEVIMRSLNHAVGDVGTIIGLGKIKIETPVDGLVDPFEPFVRAYLKLSRSSMQLPFEDLLAALPSHLLWYGAPFRLQYAGWRLREGVKYSADYPLTEDETTTSSANTASGSNTASSASSSSTAIEIKEENGSRKRSRKE